LNRQLEKFSGDQNLGQGNPNGDHVIKLYHRDKKKLTETYEGYDSECENEEDDKGQPLGSLSFKYDRTPNQNIVQSN
jgi:hypothetical protein